ncbi:hypothetical protein LK494_03200 [Anaerovorax odorimutans]|nr:hypothetical protein [Anaerovorax odorimutans]
MSGINTLNALLQGILNGIKVETSGIWSYIKLPNGIAIAWGTVVDTTTANTQEGTCYYSALNVDLPRGLFATYPDIHATPCSNYMGGVAVSNGSTKDSLRLYNYTIMNVVHTNFKIALLSIGRWK